MSFPVTPPRGASMIQKFEKIINFGIFKNFTWDLNVKAKNGRVSQFSDINIIFGRNYSGKTTLSRIVRSIEKHTFSEKFENPQFSILLSDGHIINQSNLSAQNFNIRVFNEDFVRDNLKFIFDPDQSIESFAILGSENNDIEKEISSIQAELGTNEVGNESGLYRELKESLEATKEQEILYQKADIDLKNKIKNKALDREIGIKYKPERFGDQNYSTSKLENEINDVLRPDYQVPDESTLSHLENLLRETTKPPAKSISTPDITISVYEQTAKDLIQKRVTESNKIKELIEDALLNKWVHTGIELHNLQKEKCYFCGNAISENRWSELDNHFDEESENLKKTIDTIVSALVSIIQRIDTAFVPKNDEFYSAFHDKISDLVNRYNTISEKQKNSILSIVAQLNKRKESIFTSLDFKPVTDFSDQLKQIFQEYNSIKDESDRYSSELKNKQTEAKKTLRLMEVHDFTSTISYSTEIAKIQEYKSQFEEKQEKYNQKRRAVEEKETRLTLLKNQLNDEEKGAKKVNEYLNDFFGHKYLSLKAVEFHNSEGYDGKRFRFEIIRDGKKAHHLSEGECSLISFCYFIAKLHDVNTAGQKPILWIDDPISSLDENHIFFLYSLLKTEIVETNKFKQLFVSTHNLAFLKYLKRLGGKHSDPNGNLKDYQKQYLTIEREDANAKIILMPKYLKSFVTEFNYLFGQIYNCSKIENIDDKNYTHFYNFGNNARKFLEIYLFYKFPDSTDDSEKLRRFFGNQSIPTILTERINNEYSHLTGAIERGAIPVDAPEMKSTAKLIMQRLHDIDQEQYQALENSLSE